MTETHDAFGDESCGQEYIAYGVLAVVAHRREEAEHILDGVKKSFGGHADYRLHCRELFSGDARRKSDWSHLELNDVLELYETLVRRMTAIETRRIVAVAHRTRFPLVLPAMEMGNVDPSSSKPPGSTKETQFGEKQIAAFCAQAAMTPLSKDPGLGSVHFWPDPDSTSIEWFDGKRSAMNAISGFVDLGPGVEPARIQVKRSTGGKPNLLDVADCIAYVAQRAKTRKYDRIHGRLRSLYQHIAPQEVVFDQGPDGGFIVKV